MARFDGTRFSPQITERFMRERRASENLEVLARRESEGLRLLTQGFSNQGCARSLSPGEKTIQTYVSNM